MATFGLRAATLFIVPLLLARLAGPKLLGEFVTLIALAALFTEFSTFGLHMLLTREIARLREDKEQVARLVNVSMGLVIILAMMISLLMVAIGIWLGYSTVMLRALSLAAIAIIFEALARIIMACLYGLEEMEWVSAIVFVGEAVFLTLILVIIPTKLVIDWLMTAYLISRIALVVAGARIYRPRFGRLRPAVDRRLWCTLSKKSLPFVANEVVSLVDGRLGTVILSILAGSVVVGLFEVVIALTMRMNVFVRAVNQALYPFLSSLFVKDERSVRIYTAKSIHYLLIPGFLIATILVVFGRDLVLLLYGEAFEGAVSALKLLALLIPLRFAGHSLATMLTATNRQEKRFIAIVIAAVINVMLSLILIPTYQLMGAAIAMSIAQVIMIGLFIWYVRAEVYEMIDWRAWVAPLLGSLLILWGSILFKTINTWLLITLSILLYFLIIVGVNRPRMQTLRMIATKKQW